MGSSANLTGFEVVTSGPARPRLNHLTFSQPSLDLLLLIGIAIALRAATFGHPNFFLDEAFYFASGIEMSHGAVPFVDIWDRKPWGSFALFGAIASISTDPVAYQLAATFFAALTAFILAYIARPVAGRLASLAAGITYLMLLPLFSGDGGQTPVFYNAFVAGSAWLVMRARGTRNLTAIAMLLAGIAITIKTSAIFDGIAIGVVACWNYWRLHTPSVGDMAERAVRWALIGAAPSLAIALGYWIAGYWDIFWQAMALSNIDKMYGAASSLDRAMTMASRLAPITLLAAASWPAWRGREETKLLLAWAAAGVAGLLAIPNFYAHYALPLLMPLVVLAAPFFARKMIGGAALVVLLAMAFWLAPPARFEQTSKAQAALAELASAVRGHGGDRGLLVYDGPPMLYHASGTKPLTPLMFSPHLSHAPERNVSHLDTASEVRRVLAREPGVIVIAAEERHLPSNKETRALVLDYAGHKCREVAAVYMPMRYRSDEIVVFGDCSLP